MSGVCEEFLKCQICGEEPNTAKLLSCLHSFCLSCLYKKIDSISAQGSDKIRCPKCDSCTQLPARGVVALRDNVFLQRLVRSGSYQGFLKTLQQDDTESTSGNSEPMSESTNTDQNTQPAEANGTDHNDNVGGKKDCENEFLFPKTICEVECQQCGVNDGAETRGDAKLLAKESTTATDEDPKKFSIATFHCNACDIYICEECKNDQHKSHEVLTIATARSNKESYLNQLMSEMTELMNKYKLMELQVSNALQHLMATTKTVTSEIENRSEKICNFIQQRKCNLINQITKLRKEWEEKYFKQERLIRKCQDELSGVLSFTKMVLKNGKDQDVIDMTADLAGRLHSYSKEKSVSSGSTNGAKNGVLNQAVLNLKLEIPEWAKDDLVWDKALGSLVLGVVHCGSAEVAKTFDIDLAWPTGMVQTKEHDFVVVGKTGALEQHGKILFYDRQGKLLVDHDLGKYVPFDTVSLQGGDILVSDSSGKISVFNSYGDLKDTMKQKFKGTGRMAVNKTGQILVTSSDDKKVLVYDVTGKLKDSFPGPWATDENGGMRHPHYIATNLHNECVVSDFKLNTIFLFDVNGDLLRTYKGADLPSGQLKCASAVCCDHFDNILVADFMSDCVHLVSRDGTFLGYLVSKDNGISCPNFMTVDHDGHLFIGQYGGLITVFQYMNYMRLV